MQKFQYSDQLNSCEISENDGVFHLKANENSDIICQWKKEPKDSASFFFNTISGDFTLQAEMETVGNKKFDAVFLMARESAERWVKLALEFGVDQQYNAVSVITDGTSDDANGELLESGKCWLRITRKENFWGLHHSTDGKKWRFVRCFGMEMNTGIAVGFGIQNPMGGGCEGLVKNIEMTGSAVADFRDGN